MDGVLVVDKPEGQTSHDVVSVARRLLGEKRIGHTGTLDPMATGVLPLACGRATRLVRFLTASDKDYDATIRFGFSTDTYDITGEETSRSGELPTRAALATALRSLTGEYLQTPPAYSAKKVGGRRAYEFARRQEEVALTPVPVRVSRVDLLRIEDDTIEVALTCSAGFYVRTFAHELGQLTGAGACLAALRRTRSGEFGLDGAVSLEALERDPDAPERVQATELTHLLIPMKELLPGMPALHLTGEGLVRVSHGQSIGREHVGPGWADAPWIRLFDPDGALVALATPGETADSLHPSIVLT